MPLSLVQRALHIGQSLLETCYSMLQLLQQGIVHLSKHLGPVRTHAVLRNQKADDTKECKQQQ